MAKKLKKLKLHRFDALSQKVIKTLRAARMPEPEVHKYARILLRGQKGLAQDAREERREERELARQPIMPDARS